MTGERATLRGERDRAYQPHRYTLRPAWASVTQGDVLKLVERGLVRARLLDRLGDAIEYLPTEKGVALVRGWDG